MINQDIKELKKELEILKLQREVEKLKEKPKEQPIHGGQLGQQFEEIGKSFSGIRENIPHIKLGGDKPIKYAPWAEKLRKWLFWILTILVGGTALILIIIRILSRFI